MKRLGLDARGLYSSNTDGTLFLFSDFIYSNMGERHFLELNAETGEVKGDIAIGEKQANCIYPATFAPNDNLIVYVENSDEGCPLGWTLHIASSDGTIDDTVYGVGTCCLDAVPSPDGKYLATITQGPDNILYNSGTHLSPRIIVVQLAKPIPEFQYSSMGIILGSVLLLVFLIGKYYHRLSLR
jgi:hypothetical protein